MDCIPDPTKGLQAELHFHMPDTASREARSILGTHGWMELGLYAKYGRYQSIRLVMVATGRIGWHPENWSWSERSKAIVNMFLTYARQSARLFLCLSADFGGTGPDLQVSFATEWTTRQDRSHHPDWTFEEDSDF